MLTPKNSFLNKLLGKVPLQAILIVPFVVQVVGIVGIVGYLSFRNGQTAIADLASQLQNEVVSRINQHLDKLLAAPRQINQINLDAYELGNLNLEDLDRTGRYFYKQMKVFEDVGYINFASVKGDFIGIGREDDGTLYMALMRSTDGGRYKQYSLNNEGKPIRVIGIEEYDFHQEAWYTDAVKARKPIWTSIYNWVEKPEIISISSSYPVYDGKRQMLGVIGVDLILSQINSFLKKLNVSSSGKIFILERDGLIVASSSSEKIYRIVGGKGERLNISESEDALMRVTGEKLSKRFGNFRKIIQSERLDFKFHRDRQFMQVIPWRDKLGLDWLIVVVIPESDFMAKINANTRTTIWLSIAALIVAIAIGIITSRWVTEPLIRLNFAAKGIARGEWDKTVEIDRADEIGQLANSFNYMSSQLKDSFDKLSSIISQANQVSHKITLSTSQIAIASKQLEATVSDRAASTNQASATATAIAATSGTLLKTMANIAQKAEATATAATKSQADLQEMATAMSQLAQSTNLISSRLGIMNEKANTIDSAVTIIRKVADKTNLLSINAAIEAEKAGQSGAGFAVVAREVQRLADTTAVASQDIEQMVKEIQVAVTAGVKEMDKFARQVSNNVEKVGRVAGEITQTIEQVQSLTPEFQEVSYRMEDQFAGAEQISIAIAYLSKASLQTVESLQEINRVLDQLDDTAQVLTEIISTSIASSNSPNL